jgi:hypothetical protein
MRGIAVRGLPLQEELRYVRCEYEPHSLTSPGMYCVLCSSTSPVLRVECFLSRTAHPAGGVISMS